MGLYGMNEVGVQDNTVYFQMTVIALAEIAIYIQHPTTLRHKINEVLHLTTWLLNHKVFTF